MAFTATTAADRKGLLAAIKTFATANGWSLSYDDITASGNLGIFNNKCQLALADNGSFSRSDLVNGGTVADGELVGALATSLNSANKHYFGHPGSPATVSGSSFVAVVNDLGASFSNVYLFSDAANTYIHVVTQIADRFTLFSFGHLNKVGMSHDDVAYIVGQFHTFWPNNANVASSQYGPNQLSELNGGGTHHSYGWLFENNNAGLAGPTLSLRIPANALDASLGFTATDRVVPSATEAGLPVPVFGRYDRSSGVNGAQISGVNGNQFLDPFRSASNAPTTGGAPLWPIPCFFAESGGSIMTQVGDLPDLRLVRLQGFNPGDEFSQGADTWKCFPFKRKDTFQNTQFGGTPKAAANTWDFGYAIKKVS